MPTKATTTKTGKESATGRPRKFSAASRTKPAGPSKASPATAEDAKQEAKPAPVETLSLIDGNDGKKAVRPKKSGLPPITRFGTPKEERRPPKVVAPAPAAPKEPPQTFVPAPQPEAVDLISAKPRSTKRPASKQLLQPIAPQLAPTAEPVAPLAPESEPSNAPVAPPAPAAQPAAEDTASQDDSSSKILHLKPPIVVRDLAAAMGLRAFQVIHDLMEMNIFAAITATVDTDVATRICEKHGFVFEKERREKGAGVHKPEPVVAKVPEPVEITEDELKPRAPIVTIMGHVDHGKTSLLDTIRKTRVAAGEAGGITQHIGAYSVEYDGNKITFLDTPGHAAFTAMRARGASVTDIVVLVVAADDGLMPQTIEAINHAKAANAVIIVAINKIDMVSANPDRVKKQLQEKGLSPEDWGGDTICCPVSATKGIGIDNLLSLIALQAEMLELKASTKSDTRGTVIEAEIEPGRGPTVSLIVRSGTIRVGQSFICGLYSGKIKQLIGDDGASVKSAGPATPIKILGFSGLPNAGDELVVMDSEKSAKALSEQRLQEIRLEKLKTPQRATLENLFSNTSDQPKVLRVVVKADVQGSLEAIVASLKEIPSEKISLDVIHAAVGPISESDVLLSSASDAVIIGFGVKVENNASMTSKRENVQIKLYSIIYELIDQVKEALVGMLDPELRETAIGHAEVKQVFELSKGKVGGCVVIDGRISRTARARVLRRRQPIYDGGIATLKRFQDEVKEVRNGLECGIKLGDFNDYEPGDIIECYTLEKFAQQL